jgi:hypothetical protein
MAQCDDAKRQAVELFDVGDGQKPTSLADRALRLAFRNTSPASTTRLALAPLAALVTEPVAKRWLLRSAFLQNVVAGIETAVTRRDTTRLVCLLRALADVAGGGGDDGRREVLRVGGSSLVQLLIETLAQGKYCISQIPRLSDDTILTLFFKTQAGLGGGREGDDDDEDDVDVILAGVAAAGVDDAVFRPQLPAAVLEALLLLRNVCFHRYVFPIYQIPPADCPYETDTFFFISEDNLELLRYTKQSGLQIPNSVLALNKVDLFTADTRGAVKSVARQLSQLHPFTSLFPISAKRGAGVANVLGHFVNEAPLRRWELDPSQSTDKSNIDRAVEVVRECVYQRLHKELPYNVVPLHDTWENFRNGAYKIEQTLVVDSVNVKQIVVGRRGSAIGQIGIRARTILEEIFERKVHLVLHVKVRKKNKSGGGRRATSGDGDRY